MDREHVPANDPAHAPVASFMCRDSRGALQQAKAASENGLPDAQEGQVKMRDCHVPGCQGHLPLAGPSVRPWDIGDNWRQAVRDEARRYVALDLRKVIPAADLYAHLRGNVKVVHRASGFWLNSLLRPAFSPARSWRAKKAGQGDFVRGWEAAVLRGELGLGEPPRPPAAPGGEPA